MATHLVISDVHAMPGQDLRRADYLGALICDLRPDVVVDLGDTADMASLCSYDRGLKSFQGRTYAADIKAHNEFQDRLWYKARKLKKKYPHRFRLIGNHEERIDRAINIQPELEGTISYKDLDLSSYWDEVVGYEGNTPGIITIDGISYSHFFTSGILARPISSEHSGYTLLSKKFASSTMGHSHCTSYSVRTRGDGTKIHGLVVPMACDCRLDWAGNSNAMWDRGVVIKRNVEDGHYDLEVIGMNRLRKMYD